MKEQGRSEEEPKSQKSAQLKEQGGYRKENAANNPSGALNSIRADQGMETFVADLRKNKEQLLPFCKWLMKKPANTRADRGANLAVGIYLDYVLKQHVFGIDPFASKRPGDEEPQELREALVFDLSTRGASRWLKSHPDSQAAEEVSELGTYASPGSHRRLLQEMWPLIRYMERLPEKKSGA